MLPSFLTSGYLRYKADTDAVASWLAITAKNHGCMIESMKSNPEPDISSRPQPSKRLKGKARKLAREAAANKSPLIAQTSGLPLSNQKIPRYTITIKDFVTLADAIAAATNPPVKVPVGFMATLDRAIFARRHHSEQVAVSLSQKAKSQVSTDRHGHFIGILEYVRDVLRPLMPIEQGVDSLAEAITEVPGGVMKNLTNKFDVLQVQEPSEEFLQAPDISPTSRIEKKPEVNYEAERFQDIEEAYFGFGLLLEDFRNLRKVVLYTWGGYLYGLFDLVSASLVTNTAIDIARQMQEDIQQLFDKYGGSAELLGAFYAGMCAIEGEDPEFRERPSDDMNFRMYDSAESVYLPVFMLLNSFSVLVERDNLLPFKPGYYGTFDRASDRSTKSARDKFKEDKIVLLEILSEFLTLHRTMPPQPFEDEFTRGLRMMFDTHNIPLWLVLAAQVFLDIHHILRAGVTKGFSDLSNSSKIIEKSIKENLDFHSDLRIAGWPKSNDQAFQALLDDIQKWVDSDPVEEMKRVFGLRPGEMFKLMKWHPLLCGMFVYNLKARYLELSLSFQAAWGSVMYSAHLYNALRHEELLDREWEDMELVMNWHDEIFVGEPPNKPEDYLKRFNLSMGWSAASYARNRRHTPRLPESKTGPKTMQPQANVSRMFMDRYCRGSGRTEFTEEDLQKILKTARVRDAEEENEELAESQSKAATKKSDKNHTRLTAPELLESLRNALQSERLELGFDYLALHRFCWKVLRQLREECNPGLWKIFGPGYLERESQLPFVVGYIFMAVMNTDKLAKIPRDEGAIVKSWLLICASKVVGNMIDNGCDSLATNHLYNKGK